MGAVRIFGVQKSTKEKFNTVMKNCVKAVVSVFRVPAHLAVDAFIHHGKNSSGKNLANPARVISNLGNARDESKRNILTLKDSATKSLNFENKMKEKLWKKKKSESRTH